MNIEVLYFHSNSNTAVYNTNHNKNDNMHRATYLKQGNKHVLKCICSPEQHDTKSNTAFRPKGHWDVVLWTLQGTADLPVSQL